MYVFESSYVNLIIEDLKIPITKFHCNSESIDFKFTPYLKAAASRLPVVSESKLRKVIIAGFMLILIKNWCAKQARDLSDDQRQRTF